MDKAKWCRNIHSYCYQRGWRDVQQRYTFHQIRWVFYGKHCRMSFLRGHSHWQQFVLLLVGWHPYSAVVSVDGSLSRLLLLVVTLQAFYLHKAELCSRLWQSSVIAVTRDVANLQLSMKMNKLKFFHNVCVNTLNIFLEELELVFLIFPILNTLLAISWVFVVTNVNGLSKYIFEQQGCAYCVCSLSWGCGSLKGNVWDFRGVNFSTFRYLSRIKGSESHCQHAALQAGA